MSKVNITRRWCSAGKLPATPAAPHNSVTKLHPLTKNKQIRMVIMKPVVNFCGHLRNINIDYYRLNWLSKSLLTTLAITSTVLW